MRILPSALRGYAFTVENDTIRIQLDADAVITIRLGAQQVRRIAILALPYIPVSFEYATVSAVEWTRFLTQFDLYYRKGGG